MPPKKSLFKIIVVGDSQVGKTSLMSRWVNDRFDARYKSTIGADFMCKDVTINENTCTLQVWDTAGQERFQSLGVAFYRGADAVIFACDCTNRDSLTSLKKWATDFHKNVGNTAVGSAHIVCTKNDKQPHAFSHTEASSVRDEIQALGICKTPIPAPAFVSSAEASTKADINNVFMDIAEELLIDNIDARVDELVDAANALAATAGKFPAAKKAKKKTTKYVNRVKRNFYGIPL